MSNLPTTRGEQIHLAPRIDQDDNARRWIATYADPQSIAVLDLFCGCGGLSLGFENAGMFIAAGVDAEPVACQTHAGNFLSKTLCADLKATGPESVLQQLGLKRIDVIIGGPPCQGFSALGRGRVKSLSGEQRKEILSQNDLYQHFFDFVEAARPLMFVMENVPNLRTYGGGLYYRLIRAECRRLGYEWYENVLAAADFGVPQVRRRLFIVGSRIGRGFLWPRPTHANAPVSLEEAIGDLPAISPPQLEERLPYCPAKHSEYAMLMRNLVDESNQGCIYDHVTRPVRADDREIFMDMRPGSGYQDIDRKLQRYNPDTFHDRYFMLRPDRPSISITAHLAKDGYRYIHWDKAQCRTLSVREAARIQSFGDHFRFAGYRTSRYRQIGNAVPPLLAQAIGNQVRRTIIHHRQGNDAGIWQPGLPGFEQHPQLVRNL